ncbi:hypothetical protein HPB50_028401 [Hyalomma asiaticum]|nr:hypothetical protein HPB50_028401 [Hyalomma asiaticum]
MLTADGGPREMTLDIAKSLQAIQTCCVFGQRWPSLRHQGAVLLIDRLYMITSHQNYIQVVRRKWTGRTLRDWHILFNFGARPPTPLYAPPTKRGAQQCAISPAPAVRDTLTLWINLGHNTSGSALQSGASQLR